MKQRGIVPILIVVLIALVLGGFLIYQKQTKPIPVLQQITQFSPTTTDETTNWKTYTNQQGFYLFKYPDIATVQKDTIFLSDNPSLIDNLVIKLPEDPTVQSPRDNRIIVWKNLGVNIVDVKSRDSWCKLLMDKVRAQYTCFEPSTPDFPYGEIIVNSYKAFQPTLPNLKHGYKRYFIPHGDYVYEIHLTTVKIVKESGDTYNTLEDPTPIQILSTFKFLP